MTVSPLTEEEKDYLVRSTKKIKESVIPFDGSHPHEDSCMADQLEGIHPSLDFDGPLASDANTNYRPPFATAVKRNTTTRAISFPFKEQCLMDLDKISINSPKEIHPYPSVSLSPE